jgi:hypothetical protein
MLLSANHFIYTSFQSTNPFPFSSSSMARATIFYVDRDVYLYLPGETAMALNVAEQIAKL